MNYSMLSLEVNNGRRKEKNKRKNWAFTDGLWGKQRWSKKARMMGEPGIWRADAMKPCPIVRRKLLSNLFDGPWSASAPKKKAEGKEKKRLGCAATIERSAGLCENDRRGSASHSDHGRGVAEVFLLVQREIPVTELRRA